MRSRFNRSRSQERPKPSYFQISTHHGKDVRTWFAKHARCVLHVTLMHGAWMHPVDQWFRILHRQRLRIADVASKEHRQMTLGQFIRAWNQQAHPFYWSTQSVAKAMAEAPALAA